MNFLTSLKLNAIPSSHAFTLQGRASRSEFWWFYLGSILLSIPIAIVLQVVNSFSELASAVLQVAFAVYFIYLNIAFLTCSIRRLHDRDKSGWNLLWVLLPIFGVIYLLVLYLLPGTDGANRFGRQPE